MRNENITFVTDSFYSFQNPYISLLHMGWEKCKPMHSCSRKRDMFIIHYIKSGKGKLYLENEVYNIGTGETFLLRPGQIATYTADKEEPWQYWYFGFSGVLASSFVEKTCFRNNNAVYKLDDSSIVDIIDEALESIRDSNVPDICGIEYLCRLLEKFAVNQTFLSNSRNTLADDIGRYIEQNYMENLQIGRIAEIFNISRSQLFRIFKKQKGISLEKYLLAFKIQKAKEMLVTTDLPVSQIAQFVGYKSYTTFYKQFIAVEECTPKKYRNIKAHTNENKNVVKNANGIYQLVSEMDSVDFKEKFDIKL